jgi:transcriptional regulator with XRE-family HTH domain
MSNINVSQEKQIVESIRIDRLAQRIKEKRGGTGVRATAAEVGISPATLSRVENGKIPDLETFSRICKWLNEDPSIYLGLEPATEANTPSVLVHFKKGTAIRKDSAKALGELILAAHEALLLEEEF